MKALFNPNMLLSEHFKLSEMLSSETAEKYHIPNTPLKCHITALQNLAVCCLEPTRQHFGLPIQITSGYRCPKLNGAVKGASNSQHMEGEAADITIPRKHWPFCYTSSEQIARLLFTWMKDNLDLDQLILQRQRSDEYTKGATLTWIHVLKIRFRHLGQIGKRAFGFDTTCGRFVGTLNDNLTLHEYDRSDWSSRSPEQQQLAFEAPDPEDEMPF